MVSNSLIDWFIQIAYLPGYKFKYLIYLFYSLFNFFNFNLFNLEDISRRFASQLHNEGIYSSNILNMCLKSQYLTNNHLTKMNIPPPIREFILSSEPPTFEVNHEIQDLRSWLIYCLGGL